MNAFPSPAWLAAFQERVNHDEELAVIGHAMGFSHVEAGPLVRSSYHAKRQVTHAISGQPSAVSSITHSATADS